MICHLLTFIIVLTVPFTNCNKIISVFSDFTNDKDVEFFKETFQWVVENSASNIMFNFYFKDTTSTTGERQCVLSQLLRNPYLQASYLTCEVKSETECTKSLPLDFNRLKICLRTFVKLFVKKAENAFKKFGIVETPSIILPRRQKVSDLTPDKLLKAFCGLYRKNEQPFGCINPSPNPDSAITPKPGDNPEAENTQEPESHTTPKSDETSESENTLNPDEFPDTENTPKPDQNSESETTPQPDKNSEAENTPETESESSPKPGDIPNSDASPKPDNNPEAENTPETQSSYHN